MKKFLDGKTVRVLIVKEDNNGNRSTMEVWHEQAEKWTIAIDKQTAFCSANGLEFPELNWQTKDSN